ncbi:hypothetical protein COCOR_04818 [Corallococcus coralloides DSM 2259]|uniref:Uncharacterized protein n=1 Tax=Corallococcus coralloides (strain ATCC 25202 / DSM 2259 / NBRC 100086 / M2) TaxID=1144275 RepID=H8MM39_CORCM|nr:hypothetical protein [Corallococcus coralloides]AFE06045.1 hypothetical protein COCOR_04818 [Corallococcus coralloides DSM 2259]
MDAFKKPGFQADSLADRAHALKKLLRPLVSLAGQGLGAGARGLGLEDAGIFLTRVSGNRA